MQPAPLVTPASAGEVDPPPPGTTLSCYDCFALIPDARSWVVSCEDRAACHARTQARAERFEQEQREKDREARRRSRQELKQQKAVS